jgi:hypothetical protein
MVDSRLPRFLFLAAATALLAGCAKDPKDDESSSMEFVADSAPSITVPKSVEWITVRNRGFIVDEGPVNPEGEYWADLWNATGGTLIITTTKPDGSSTRQELKYKTEQVQTYWDSWVDFRWDPNTKQYVIEGPQLRSDAEWIIPVEFRLEYGQFNDKPVTAGVNVASSAPLLTSPRRLDYTGVELGFPFGTLGQFKPKLELDFKWGNSSTQGSFGGGPNGWVYQGGPVVVAGSPMGGYTGVQGSVPSVSSITTDYDSQVIRFVVSRPSPFFDQSRISQKFEEYLVYYDRVSRRYNGAVDFPAIVATGSYDNQKVTQYDIGVGAGLVGRHDFGNGFSFLGDARLNGIYYWGDYDGMHHYMCSVCAPATRDFTQSTHDSASGFTWSGFAQGTIAYRLSTRAELSVRFDYDYQNKILALRNHVTPDDLARRFLGAGSAQWYGVSLGVRYTLGSKPVF